MPRMSIEQYAQMIGKKLYPYQIEIAEAILDSIFGKQGLTISVMLARQMGKNETSAII